MSSVSLIAGTAARLRTGANVETGCVVWRRNQAYASTRPASATERACASARKSFVPIFSTARNVFVPETMTPAITMAAKTAQISAMPRSPAGRAPAARAEDRRDGRSQARRGRKVTAVPRGTHHARSHGAG